MDALITALGVEEPIGALDRPALDLARIEYPELDPEPYVVLLDELSRRVASSMESASGPAFVTAANHVLFRDFGLAGNEADFYDPRNSFLNDVLIRRKGIPITLCLIYMEVARRLNRPVYGISLPGHFLVRYDDGEHAVFIDPYHAGIILTREQCVEMARTITAIDLQMNDSHFAPAPLRVILTRMLNNLRTIYIHREQWDKLLPILDLLLSVTPESAEEYRQRAVAWVQTGHLHRGHADFQRYLELAPDATDREQVVRQLQAIHNILARLN